MWSTYMRIIKNLQCLRVSELQAPWFDIAIIEIIPVSDILLIHLFTSRRHFTPWKEQISYSPDSILTAHHTLNANFVFDGPAFFPLFSSKLQMNVAIIYSSFHSYRRGLIVRGLWCLKTASQQVLNNLSWPQFTIIDSL